MTITWPRWMPLLCLLVAGTAAESWAQTSAGDALFDSAKVMQWDLSLTPEQFEALNPTGGGPGFGPPRFGPPGFGGAGPGRPGFGRPASAPANAGQSPGAADTPPAETHRNMFGVELPWSSGNLTVDGQTLKDVGIRYKGNYTFLATARSLKKSFKIDFNRKHKEQTLAGLSMVNLHCGVSDPTLSRESLSLEFFRQAGVPAPRTLLVELFLTVPGKYDRELVGVYTLTEQVNKEFLLRHFQDGTGMLLKPEGLQAGPTYLGDSWKAYKDLYRPEDSPTQEQKQRLIDFARLISQAPDDAFAQQIGSYLDVDAFLRFIATNALLSNMDSYLGFGHNYYLYLNPTTEQFVFIPWDLDLSLATWPAVGTPEQLVTLSIEHPHAGENPLLDRLFANPEYKQKYLAMVKELIGTHFTHEKLVATLEPIEAALKEPIAREREAVAAREPAPAGGGFGAGFGAGFGNGQFGQSMLPRQFIEQRIASVTSQLAGETTGFEPRPFGFGPPGGGFGPPGGGFGPGRGLGTPKDGGPGAANEGSNPQDGNSRPPH